MANGLLLSLLWFLLLVNKLLYGVLVDLDEYNSLCTEQFGLDTVKALELKNQAPRTLLRGISISSLEWHVYLDENFRFWCIVYPSNCSNMRCAKYTRMLGANPRISDLLNIVNSPTLPPKEALDLLYPDCCDYEFCRLLILKGVSLSFDLYIKQRNGYGTYMGLVAADDWYNKLKSNTE